MEQRLAPSSDTVYRWYARPWSQLVLAAEKYNLILILDIYKSSALKLASFGAFFPLFEGEEEEEGEGAIDFFILLRKITTYLGDWCSISVALNK